MDKDLGRRVIDSLKEFGVFRKNLETDVIISLEGAAGIAGLYALTEGPGKHSFSNPFYSNEVFSYPVNPGEVYATVGPLPDIEPDEQRTLITFKLLKIDNGKLSVESGEQHLLY